MRLLLKHLAQSIRRKPTQPLIITLTLALSVAITIFALTVYDSLVTDADMAQAAKYGSADFTVELGSSSDSRFLFASDVRDSLGDRVNAVGVYPLPLILDGTGATASGVATELASAGELFSVAFFEYGCVTDSTLSEIAFVSADFAERRGISLGDVITVETMGRRMSYRVEGVSDRSFVGGYDVMVDISSVMRVFADESLLFAAIGDKFKPSSTVYVDVLDEAVLGEALDSLKADSRFEGMRFVDVRDTENAKEYTKHFEVSIGIAVVLILLLAGIVTFCCFFILANQRREENFTLSSCGASPWILGVMQYVEVLIYFLVGAPLGILLSVPTVQAISPFVGFAYVKARVLPDIAAISAFMLLAVCILTVSLFIAFSKRASRTGDRKHRAGLAIPLFFAGAMAMLLGVLYAIPARLAFSVYCIQLVVIILFLFFATSPLLQRLSLLVDRIMHGARSEKAISFRYAVKNASSLKILHNISMLCALAVLTLFTVGFIHTGFSANLRAYTEIIRADFTVYNVTDRCYDKIESCEEVEVASRFYMNLTDGFIVFSSQNESIYSPILDISRQPEGNEVILSKGLAEKFALHEGDLFEMELEGEKYSFRLSHIAETCIGIAVINCEDVGIPYNSVMVRGDADVSRTDLLAALSAVTVAEIAPIQATENLLENVTDTVNTYIRAIVILLAVLGVFFAIGTLDALYECMRARGEDYALYRLAGISKGRLTLMRVTEIAFPILFGVVLGALVSVISIISVNRGMSSFGMIPFLIIKMLVL